MNRSSAPDISTNIELRPYNTLGVEAMASYFVTVNSVDQLRNVLENHSVKQDPVLILGGGSNILFVDDYPGLVINIDITGIDVVDENEKNITIRAGAGENWHGLVQYCVERNWGGIENLSLIPGKAGAAPIQNIGAYGVELQDVFVSLEALEIDTGILHTFEKEDCRFGYRESIFKREYKDRFVITSIVLALSKQPEVQTSYGAIEDKLKEKGIENPTIRDISNIVIGIRNSKLPDPSDLGNAGSFFKNPVVDKGIYDKIRNEYPDVPGYPVNESKIKVPAGWLIEQTGWKGKIKGNAGTYRQQALVIVNHGGATGREILELANEIKGSVVNRFGIELVPEVNIIG